MLKAIEQWKEIRKTYWRRLFKSIVAVILAVPWCLFVVAAHCFTEDKWVWEIE